MGQPQGMRNDDYPHHVCRLHKAIYGVKQAPRAWYQELRTFLLSLGYVTSHVRTCPSLFTPTVICSFISWFMLMI